MVSEKDGNDIESLVTNGYFFCLSPCFFLCIPRVAHMFFTFPNSLPLCLLRSADFPTSLGGKGHDTAVVCRWLEKLLLDMDTGYDNQ